MIGGQTFLKCGRATNSTLLSDTAKNGELGICFIYKSECIVTVIKKIFLMQIIVIFSYKSSTIFTFVPVLFLFCSTFYKMLLTFDFMLLKLIRGHAGSLKSCKSLICSGGRRWGGGDLIEHITY